jgi:hypothetical protein
LNVFIRPWLLYVTVMLEYVNTLPTALYVYVLATEPETDARRLLVEAIVYVEGDAPVSLVGLTRFSGRFANSALLDLVG